MLEIKVADGQCRIKVQGDVKQTAAELGMVISSIWMSYARHNPMVAAAFQTFMKALMCHPQSPTFTMRDVPGRVEIILPKK